MRTATRRLGANLYTCTIVALNPDTGKLVWYFQSSPHDTHDWDTVMTPVLFDGTFKGKPRKMLAQANKNGLFFVLDRTDGKALISEAFVPANWVKGYDDRGQPIPDPTRSRSPTAYSSPEALAPTGRRRATIPIPVFSTSIRAKRWASSI